MSDRLPDGMRAAAIVDLGAIEANLGVVADQVGGIGRVMAVVKADAYGHGMLPVSRLARKVGVEWLGVALPSEAVALRAGGDGGRILAWLYAPGDPALAECVRQGVDLSVSAGWALDEIMSAGRAVGRVPMIQLKADTGLGRGGSSPSDWPALCERAAAAEAAGAVRVTGAWSHLASSDDPRVDHTDRQVVAFRDALAVAHTAGLAPGVRHLANSGAALARPDTCFDLVRTGIAAYGLTPGAGLGSAAALGLRPAMTLAARVALVKRIPRGHGVSYGLTWTAPHDTTVALVPIGYADGVPRAAGGLGAVAIRGRAHRIVGRVAMDQLVVDAGDDEVREGDVATVFGPGDDGEPTADDLAAAIDTIGYEIVTRIGPRVPRLHVASSSADGEVL